MKNAPFFARRKIPGKKPAPHIAGLPHEPVGNLKSHESPDALRQRAAAWMAATPRPVRDAAVAREAIAWAASLPGLKVTLAPEEWSVLANFLTSLAVEVEPQAIHAQSLVHQLLAVELAWTLAARLPDGKTCRRLAKSGRVAIALGLGEILDSQGMPPAPQFRFLGSLLGCWTRCRAMSATLPGAWGPRAEQRYRRLLRNAVRCTRPDGRPLFEALLERQEDDSGGLEGWGRELFASALEGGDDIDRRLAAMALPDLATGTAPSAKKSPQLPPASIYCEAGAVAVMRRNWSHNDERIAVLFAGRSCEIELIASGQIVASGPWQFEITRQGQPLAPVSNWESNCWYSDEEVDYLELEIELAGGVKLERQIVLAREDRFLLLADAVLGSLPGELEYRGVLPLAPQVHFQPAAEGREGLLVRGNAASKPKRSADRPLAQVLPLALPEWRANPSTGELQAVIRELEIRHARRPRGSSPPSSSTWTAAASAAA